MSTEAAAYLAQFDNFSTEKKGGGGKRPKLDQIKDGAYTFQVVSSSLEMAAGKPIWRLILSTGGTNYEHSFWLDSQVACNIAGVFLIGLGVAADAWQPGEFHKRFPTAIESVKGARFSGKKTTNDKGYPVLYANDFLGKVDAPDVPHTFTNADDAADIPF